MSPRQRSSSRFLARVPPGAKPAPFPGFIAPMLATPGSKVPKGPGYVHEMKLDGYRVQAHLNDGRVTLFTRSGLDWTKRFPTIAADIARLPAGKLVIDGEVVSPDANGRPNFAALQDDLKRRRYDRMIYYVFDLLHLHGFDTRGAPLIERKRVLKSFLTEAASFAPGVIYSEHFDDGIDLYKRAFRMGLEASSPNAPMQHIARAAPKHGSRSNAGRATASRWSASCRTVPVGSRSYALLAARAAR
jgi:bifunctional non-homologous end joining protein LigD